MLGQENSPLTKVEVAIPILKRREKSSYSNYIDLKTKYSSTVVMVLLCRFEHILDLLYNWMADETFSIRFSVLNFYRWLKSLKYHHYLHLTTPSLIFPSLVMIMLLGSIVRYGSYFFGACYPEDLVISSAPAGHLF